MSLLNKKGNKEKKTNSSPKGKKKNKSENIKEDFGNSINNNEKTDNFFDEPNEKQTNDLKIELYPQNSPRGTFRQKQISKIIKDDILCHSLDETKKLGYYRYNVPVLESFYNAHINHFPIRIKPDDIWLLIVQAFSYHVNLNSEKLRNKFVNFDGKAELVCKFFIDNPKKINKKIASSFSEQINSQMEKYLGKEVLDILSPDFSTTDSNSTIIFKISIMNAFKKYFNYTIRGLTGCGIPYIILEGTIQDYEKIISKTKFLEKYDFSWYTGRIIPHIEKMLEAKKGKIDIDFFKNIIQKKEVTEWAGRKSGRGGHKIQVDKISGWFLHFFPYDSNGDVNLRDSVEVSKMDDFAKQVLDVPFSFDSEKEKKSYNLQYNVGFVGCEQNEKHEIIPVTGWFITEKKEKKTYFTSFIKSKKK